MALIYLFENLFNGTCLTVNYLLLHSFCCDRLFWLKYRKKICPPTDMWLECILIATSDNGGTFSLILSQNLTHGCFLEVSWNVETERCTPFEIHIKTTGDLALGMNLLSMHNFLTSHFGHLEYCPWSYKDLPKAGTFHYTVSQNITLTNINDLIIKVFNGKLSTVQNWIEVFFSNFA